MQNVYVSYEEFSVLVNHHDLRLLFCISTTYLHSLSKIGSERLLIAGSFQDPLKNIMQIYSYSCTKLNNDTVQFCADGFDLRFLLHATEFVLSSSVHFHIYLLDR